MKQKLNAHVYTSKTPITVRMLFHIFRSRMVVFGSERPTGLSDKITLSSYQLVSGPPTLVDGLGHPRDSTGPVPGAATTTWCGSIPDPGQGEPGTSITRCTLSPLTSATSASEDTTGVVAGSAYALYPMKCENCQTLFDFISYQKRGEGGGIQRPGALKGSNPDTFPYPCYTSAMILILKINPSMRQN